MNNHLEQLEPYPFERMAELLHEIQPRPGLSPVAWSLGEPKHPAPDFLIDLSRNERKLRRGLGTYPPTKGLPELRRAIATFINARYRLSRPLDPDREVLPVNGTREALFAFAQAVLEPGSLTLMPNPFYQIYEGAAILAGSKPFYLDCTEDHGFLPDLDGVSDDTWDACQLIYICSPGNPTGAVMPCDRIEDLVRKSNEFNFVIASDECYSEIYLDESDPPPGLLEAAAAMGQENYKNCVVFNSLSKRSNLPGLRSGYVAGDGDILEAFLRYRTYHGSAMPLHHQLVSMEAWRDESHVVENRARYREKFARVTAILNDFWPVTTPAAGFYLWPSTPYSDTEFAIRLVEEANVRVLPGSFLSRDTDTGNPGSNHVRIALVATLDECVEASERLRDNWTSICGP